MALRLSNQVEKLPAKAQQQIMPLQHACGLLCSSPSEPDARCCGGR
jgi:hypothetical protein